MSEEPLSSSDVIDYLRRFGEHRETEGDVFVEADFTPGRFLYSTRGVHVGIGVWGEPNWSFSAFAAARVNMHPTLELYRYVSRWRATCTHGAPYVIEDPKAAVMCEIAVPGSALDWTSTSFKLLTAAIDSVADVTRIIAADLAEADGLPMTASGMAGLAVLHGWWEISDSRVMDLLRHA